MLRAFLIYLVALAVEISLALFFCSSDGLSKSIAKEQDAIYDVLGDGAALRVQRWANESYASLVQQSGLQEFTYSLFIPTSEQVRKSEGLEPLGQDMFPYVRERLDTAWRMIALALERVFGFWLWLPFLVPFVAAAAYDGVIVRRVKLLSFGMSSAPIYGASMHALLFLAFVPFFYASAPFQATPLLVPAWYFGLAVSVKSLLSNLQRM